MVMANINWRAVFLAALAEVPVVSRAAEAAGVTYRHVYKTREVDQEFAQAWEDAIEASLDKAEQEAFRRAVVGFEEPVIHKGRMAYRMELKTREVVHATTGEKHLEEYHTPVLDDKGQPVPLTVRKHSDGLLSLVLKGRRRYTDRSEITGGDGKPLVPVDDTAAAARVAQLMAIATARRDAPPTFDDLV